MKWERERNGEGERGRRRMWGWLPFLSASVAVTCHHDCIWRKRMLVNINLPNCSSSFCVLAVIILSTILMIYFICLHVILVSALLLFHVSSTISILSHTRFQQTQLSLNSLTFFLSISRAAYWDHTMTDTEWATHCETLDLQNLISSSNSKFE